MTTEARFAVLRDLRRRRDDAAAQRVTGIELFFDLVFVFAVTQLSHSLLPQPTVLGALHTALLFGAVWWVWIDTAWVTNWLDPDLPPVRLMLLALMLGGLVVAAFGSRGLIFALCYGLMQVGRSLFTLWALRGCSPGNFRNFQRITIWMAASAVFWLAGGLAGEGLRFVLWAVALALDLASAWLGFWVPGLGRSTTADWDVAGGHLAERCSGFVLIALGESITVTGAAFFQEAWSVSVVLAFVAAFVGTAAMWWIYFDTGAEHGSRRIEESDDPGHLARLVYTYVHVLIVAAVILGAVADEMALAEPGLRAGGAFLWVVLAAPALYLLGNILFKWVVMGRLPLSHLVGLGLLVLLWAVASAMSLLWLNAATSLVLVVVAVWEMSSYRRVTAA
jgi:low temperature requirement protein LtrA